MRTICFLLFFSPLCVFAQHPDSTKRGNIFNPKGVWGVSAGYSYQKNHNWIEITAKKYFYKKEKGWDLNNIPISYFIAGAETEYNKKLQVAPKIGVGHYHFIFFNFNLSCILYNNSFQAFYPTVTPEIGLSLPLGIVQINYGYNIFLTPHDFMREQTHKISVHITFPFLKQNEIQTE